VFLVVYIKGEKSSQKEYTMNPLRVKVEDIKYRRPGLTKIDFVAEYSGYTRRGTVVYDTTKQQFITHTKDIGLLAAICIDLQTPSRRRVG
jgi:hypothetical protein